MSYEHCERHDEEATNGCLTCEGEATGRVLSDFLSCLQIGISPAINMLIELKRWGFDIGKGGNSLFDLRIGSPLEQGSEVFYLDRYGGTGERLVGHIKDRQFFPLPPKKLVVESSFEFDPKGRPLVQSKIDGKWYPEKIPEFTTGQALIVAELLGKDIFDMGGLNEVKETLQSYVKDKNDG